MEEVKEAEEVEEKAEGKEGEAKGVKEPRSVLLGPPPCSEGEGKVSVSQEEWEEMQLMRRVLATRQGKALFLDYLQVRGGVLGRCWGARGWC